MQTRHFLALALLASSAAAGCSKLHKPSSIPSAPSVPGGASGEVDPNTCGNYAASDAGAKLKAFLQATKDLDAAAAETTKVIKESCVMMGQELGMSADLLRSDDTKHVCNEVIDTYKHNLKVNVKAEGGIKIMFVPGQCHADAQAQASASAACEGHAGTGGNGGQCAASAGVNASIHAECTPPQFDIEIVKPKLIVDTSQLEMTIHAMKDGLPKLFSVSARLQLLKDATAQWVESMKELKAMPLKFVQSFGDQAACVSGQIGAAANASTHIQANVSVSVEVSASASGSVGSN